MRVYFTMAYSQMYLPHWEGMPATPTMIPASTCISRHTGRLRVPAASSQATPLVLDSGGFVFALKHGDYPFSHLDYIAWAKSFGAEWIATMDYPCELQIAADQAAIHYRQERCITNACRLLDAAPALPWTPVLQGRVPADYLAHAEAHSRAGILLPRMGIGSLCARKNSKEVHTIVNTLAAEHPSIQWHLFGTKCDILTSQPLHPNVASMDTAAWNRRFGPRRRELAALERERGWSQRYCDLHHCLPIYRRMLDARIANRQQHKGTCDTC